MKAKISSTIFTNTNRMWEELNKTASLKEVSNPIIVFKTQNDIELPEKWELNREYPLFISAFGIIPLGKHYIVIHKIDTENKVILTHEYGTLTKTWDHTVKIDVIDENRIRYTDEIDIKAGIKTILIWLFAHCFYRHRQRKWKAKLRR